MLSIKSTSKLTISDEEPNNRRQSNVIHVGKLKRSHNVLGIVAKIKFVHLMYSSSLVSRYKLFIQHSAQTLSPRIAELFTNIASLLSWGNSMLSSILAKTDLGGFLGFYWTPPLASYTKLVCLYQSWQEKKITSIALDGGHGQMHQHLEPPFPRSTTVKNSCHHNHMALDRWHESTGTVAIAL